MFCASPVHRFQEQMPPHSATHNKGGCTHFILRVFPLQSGRAGICCCSRAGPQFSALLIPEDPALLSDGWWQVCVLFCHCSCTCPRLEPCSRQVLPSQPQIGTKVQLGIVGWGAQVTLSIAFPWAKLTPAPGRWLGVGWDRWCSERKGTSVATCQGLHPIPLGLCSGHGESHLGARGLG